MEGGLDSLHPVTQEKLPQKRRGENDLLLRTHLPQESDWSWKAGDGKKQLCVSKASHSRLSRASAKRPAHYVH